MFVSSEGIVIREFVQKSGKFYRKFLLYEDKVLFEQKAKVNSSKYEIKLEDLGFTRHYQRTSKTVQEKVSFILMALFAIGSFVFYFLVHDKTKNQFIFFGPMCLLFAIVIYFKKYQDDIYLTGGRQNLVFYRTIPDEQTVLDFISEIENTTNTHLRNKYSTFSKYMQDHEVLSRLSFLKNKNLLTDEECDELYQEYKISRLL